jgi:uncharacterized Zn finger protein
MSEILIPPTCYVCRSEELEIVTNDEFGPLTMCTTCGYAWLATYEDFESPLLLSIAS